MNPSIARNPFPESKNALRKTLLETRLHAAPGPAGTEALSRRLLDALKRYEPACVGFYWPLPGEFDARAAIAIWLAPGVHRQASLPVVRKRGEALEFHAWAPDTPMKIGHHRIPEPAAEVAVVPDLLFVPCVGFDGEGYRLGYGGGYYDRTLAELRADGHIVAIGVAYAGQEVAQLPHDVHDQRLDGVVTERGFRKFG